MVRSSLTLQEEKTKDKSRKEGCTMKKIIIALLVIVLATPAMAAVTLTAADEGNSDGWVSITYAADAGEGKRPRAFGLNIEVSAGNIVDVDVAGAEPFRIYMGNVVIDVNGDVADYGSPVAPATALDTPGQLGTSSIVIEMGSLYDPCIPSNPNQPAYSGGLIRVQVSETCTLTVSANAVRADTGVILEDQSSAVVSYTAAEAIPVSLGCYTGPDAAEWEAVGSPDSWCNARQCHGDADGVENEYGAPDPFTGLYEKAWVSSEDVTVLVTGFRQTYGGNPAVDTWISADFDHVNNEYGAPDPFTGLYEKARVSSEDVTILITYFRQTVPADCLD